MLFVVTGICLGMDDMPLVVLPYMKHGDLLTYIRNEQNVSIDDCSAYVWITNYIFEIILFYFDFV